MFATFTQIIREGFLPCLKMYIDFLLGEGLFLGVGVIVLPLLGRIVYIFKKLLWEVKV